MSTYDPPQMRPLRRRYFLKVDSHSPNKRKGRENPEMSREVGTVQIWQSIETAPRDGSTILLWARSETPPDATSSVMVGRYDISFGCVTASYGVMPIVPTHWMPLPNAPHLDDSSQNDPPPRIE
jgi:hypothetical protein